MGVSPVKIGAVNDTFALVFETMKAVPIVGASGTRNVPRKLKPDVILVPDIIIVFILLNYSGVVKISSSHPTMDSFHL